MENTKKNHKWKQCVKFHEDGASFDWKEVLILLLDIQNNVPKITDETEPHVLKLNEGGAITTLLQNLSNFQYFQNFTSIYIQNLATGKTIYLEAMIPGSQSQAPSTPYTYPDDTCVACNSYIYWKKKLQKLIIMER